MPPPVNLTNVNLTLQQFQDVANGKYNAGEVRLTSDHSLGAVNNFVHRTGRNKVAIPHAEVLAIKDAFVKALQHEGIAANEINRVRQELGLAPVGTTDTALSTRSIRPLSRQQIRNILDRYADTLTEHNDNLNIITYEANHINYTDRERTEIVRTRNRTNADLMKSRALLPDRRIVDVQNVIAGNVHFASQAERLRLIAVAESQKAFLTNGPDHPSDAPDALLRYPIPEKGLTLTFPLGMSEADYVRKLDDMLTLLRGERHPDDATLAVRNAFRKVAASGPEAVARWGVALAQDPQGAFKARTIAIGLLLDRGVDDWETLSLVNRVSDFAALTLLSQLTNQLDPNLRGDALRQDPAVAALAEQVEAEGAIPADRQAYVPALSSAEANANTINVLKGLTMSVPTHETATVQASVRHAFETRYGADLFSANATFSSIVPPGDVDRAFAALGPGRPTAEQLRDALVDEAAPFVAHFYLSKALKPMIQAAGGVPGTAVGLATALFVRHPNLKARLVAAQSPEQAQAALAEFHNEIAAGVRRHLAIPRGRALAVNVYREKIAAALGVPVAALEARGVLDLSRLNRKSEDLGIKIADGRSTADTDQQIEESFRGLANVSADVRINLLRKADGLDIAPEARDILKNQILTIRNAATVNLDLLRDAANGIALNGLVSLLADAANGNVKLDAIRRAMAQVGTDVATAVRNANAGGDLGADEMAAWSSLVLTFALARQPGSFDLLRSFFARPEAANMSLVDQKLVVTDVNDPNPRSRAEIFAIFRPDQPAAESNAALADAIGKPGLAPLHGQAIALAFDDLGLGGLTADEKANLLSEYHNIGHAIMEQVRTAAQPVSPSQLRAIARAHLMPEAVHQATVRHLAALAGRNGVDNPAEFLGGVNDVLFRRNPNLRKAVEDAINRAFLNGQDLQAAVRAVLEPHDATALKALQSFAALRDKKATAKETAVREIAARAQLDEALVREKLEADGLRQSLVVLEAGIRDELANPDTDVAQWDPQSVAARADERIESFIAKKAAFLTEVIALPLSDSARGALVVTTLSEGSYTDADLPAAARQILPRRDEAPIGQADNSPLGRVRREVKAAFDYAKSILTAEKVALLSDEDLFTVFENVGEQINAAIEAVLSEEKRNGMDRGDQAVIRELIGAALVDYCGQTLLDAAARLAADGRFDTLDAAGEAVRRRYDSDYMTYAFGRNAQGQAVPIDQAKAREANKSVAAAALGIRLVNTVKVALDDAWLPADLADAVASNTATAVQEANAAALVKHAPGLVAELGAGLAEDKRARFKSFAIALDYRDHALASTKELLRAAADALRVAPSVDAAEARLQELAGSIFQAQAAAAAIAAAAQMAGVALDEAQTTKAVALLSEFGAGMPVKNARVLARFIVNLKLTDETADVDRRRVVGIAPQIAGWRDFGLVDPPAGKAEFADFFKLEANALFADYMNNEAKFQDDHFNTMIADISRATYVIGGTTYVTRPVGEVMPEFDRIVTSPKARRAISILMSQTSAPPLSQVQVQMAAPRNALRQQPLDTSTLPGAGAFVSRSSKMPPDLFLSPTMILDPQSVYKVTVSPEGTTATVTLSSVGQMVVGTEGDTMESHFGSVVVEREYTLDLTAENPVVTGVRVTQTFSDSTDLNGTDHLNASEPFPPRAIPAPPVPPAAG